jgi:hypothetical protein
VVSRRCAPLWKTCAPPWGGSAPRSVGRAWRDQSRPSDLVGADQIRGAERLGLVR